MSRLRVGIVGVGRAGRARARAVAERDDVELVGVHRGRFAADTGVAQMDGDTLIERSDVVVVCSPTDTHAGWCTRALEAERHVIVEYPVAISATEADRLFSLAQARRRVLHVEHIELLTPVTRWLVRHMETPVRMQMRFESTVELAHGGIAQVSRIHRLVAVGGPVAAVSTTRTGPRHIDAVVHLASGIDVPFVALQGTTRQLQWELWDGQATYRVQGRSLWRDGVEVPLAATALFAEDLDVALQRIRGGGDVAYVSDHRILGCLRAAEAFGSVGKTILSGVRW